MPNTWPWPAYGSRRRTSQSGQAMAIGAALLIVLTGMAGLVIDGGHDYLVRRQAQTAVDMGALAAGKQIALLNSFLNGAPTSGSVPLVAAHDFVTGNGFGTVYSTRCDSGTSNSFITSWFDSGAPACGATSGFVTKVTVQVPAVATPGIPIPANCVGQTQYNCVQVTLKTQVNHFFGAVLGIANAYITVSATVFAQPAGITYNTPPPQAVYLYQASDDCTLGPPRQCFTESVAPGRQQMSCSISVAPTNNCPTLWVRSGTRPMFAGVDGTRVNPQGDQIALESNGDMLLQDATTICDPNGGSTCTAGTATGSKGFGRANLAKIYCSTVSGTLFLPGCTTTGQTGLNSVSANETTFLSNTWTASVDPSGLPPCGALVLDGDTVSNSYTAAGSIAPGNAICYPRASEPYTIQPGKYQYIVINHGAYHFEGGVYDILGSAPVNTASGAGYRANGIDHSLENAGDFDLCPTPGPTACPTLTAGVWIGHGGGSFTPATAGTASNCAFTGGGTPGTQGGGGDPTDVGGTSVAFRFEASAGGFVSTGEVHSIALISPGLGQYSILGGIPILFDLENNNFIHLDAIANSGKASQFTGLIYQTPTATGGGLELDPSLGQSALGPALVGQVRAYSLTTFGNSGTAVSFRSGYGTSSVPPVTTSGRNESQIIGSASLLPALNGVSGMESFQMVYVDEWALDAYGVYIKVNNGSPIFFSKGVWSPVPGPSSPVPPSSNIPGDSNPDYPNPAAGYASNYTTLVDGAGNPDWTISLPNGTANNSLFEIDGVWAWGHESEITGASPNWSFNQATINFTFPTPAGSTVHVQIFMTDGDFCGDYAIGSFTFNNIGQPGGGLQSGASVSLVQ